MSTTIVTAEEDTKGYVLTDLGTYAVLKEEGTNLAKIPLLGSDPVLYNPYSFHVIDETAFDGIDLNTEAAKAFLDFLEDPVTIQKVKDFTVGGQILFTPIGG
jgi:ABC-type tungstate transport system permease subunit